MLTSGINKRDIRLSRSLSSDKDKFHDVFVKPLAGFLYQEIWNSNRSLATNTSGKEFKTLSQTEKNIWYRYVTHVPGKYKAMHLYLLPFDDFCRTCIITEDEVSNLVKKDLQNILLNKIVPGEINDREKFFSDLNYLIPVGLKKLGYEIIRHEEIAEINDQLIKGSHGQSIQDIFMR